MSLPKTEAIKVRDAGKLSVQQVRRGAGLMALLAVAGLFWVGRQTLPFGIDAPAFLEGASSEAVNPQSSVAIRGIGYGTRLAHVEMRDESGRLVAEARNQSVFEPAVTLEYGRRYSLSISAERLWLGQKAAREIRFATVNIPRLESRLRQELAADGSVELRFAEPVGKLSAASDLPLEVKPDAQRQSFRLKVSGEGYGQGGVHQATINWETTKGVTLPPFDMAISTAPALTAAVPIQGMKNLGLAMPIQIDFSEPLINRAKASESIHIRTRDGEIISGKWLWYGKQRLQFMPQPYWPASSTIEVTVDAAHLRTLRGGFLAKSVDASFTTGADKRIQVFLDKQRVEIIENGEVVKVLKASTGKSKTPTVTGDFYIYARYPTKTMKSRGLKPGEKGYYEVKDVPYAQYFHEGYAFHGAFWHNNFGHPASHGCVNLATQKKNARKGVSEDAGWLYQWATLGVPVSVYQTAPAKDSVVTTQIEPENANPEKENIDLPASN